MGKIKVRELQDRYRLLRDWYGRDAARTEMAAHVPPAQALSDVLVGICADFVDPDIQVRMELEARWNEIAGKGMPWLRLSSFSCGVLLLEVKHPAMLRELSGCAEIWRDRVNQVLERPDLCCEVRFVPAGRGTRP